MSREGKLVKNTLILSVGTFLPALANFVVLPILTGCLTQEEYGTYDLITVLVSLLLPAATLQIQLGAFRFLIEEKHDEEKTRVIISNIVAFILPVSIIPLIILFFCWPKLEIVTRLFICLYLIVDIFVDSARQVCRGLGKTKDYSVSAIIAAAGKVILVVISVYVFRMGLKGAVISLFTATFLSLVYLVLKAGLYKLVRIRYVDIGTMKEMLKYSWPMVPNSMSAWVMKASDRFVITAVMGISANAVYAVAYKIPSILSIAQNTFTLAWQENASIASKDSDASEYYSSMFRNLLHFLTGFFCMLIAFTPLLFKMLIRGNYDEAYRQMPILLVAMFFLGLSTYLGGIFIAHKRTKSIGITTVAAAIINLVTDIATIGTIGLYAASGSTLISYLFLFVFRMITVQKIVKVNIEKKKLLICVALIVLTSVLCYMQNTVLDCVNVLIGITAFIILNRSLITVFSKKIKSAVSTGKGTGRER